MDWLNLHTSVLDSPEFIRCDPTRRATWLMLLRFCAGQENSGRIAGCKEWGDTTWQQMARVRLKEVRAVSPLWAWEGDDLVVQFYPTEKETEVRAKRELARTNGQRGGRPKKTIVGSRSITEKEPTLVNSPKAEGNGMERKGMEVSAAAPPHAQATQPTPPEPGLFDPSQAVPAPRPTPKADWIFWRQTHPRIYVGRSDEDGRLADWQALFDRAGNEVMDAMYLAITPTITNPKHGVSFKAAAAWIDANTVPA